MTAARTAILLLAMIVAPVVSANEHVPDPSRDILVTLVSAAAAPVSGGIDAPYRKRKRYAVAQDVGLLAIEIGSDYGLREIARWPIRSLSVICIVFRVAGKAERDAVIDRMQADTRVESAQRLQRFETRTAVLPAYDDTYIDMQSSLATMSVAAAHRYTRGAGVRIAVIDGAADLRHEDLDGRVSQVQVFTGHRGNGGTEHGTAVASVIGARANNARGIVGVAPDAAIELYVACWTERGTTATVCDSFTLAKALDSLLARSADVVNLSLAGPHDPLLARLLSAIHASGSVIVAADPPGDAERARFPADLRGIVSAASGEARETLTPVSLRTDEVHDLYAPGEQIVVAIPGNHYDFRSGSSLAAAHVSGVAALLLSLLPELANDAVVEILRNSQHQLDNGFRSINACAALQLAAAARPAGQPINCPRSGTAPAG